MTYRAITWTLFVALFATAPAILFLVQVIFLVPAIFFVAGMVALLPKLLDPAHTGESLAFLGFLAASALVHAGLLYLVAAGLARAISWLPSRAARVAALGAACAGLVVLAFSPVYGGGGHGQEHLLRLPQALAEIDRGYGPATVWKVYGTTAAAVGVVLLARRRRAARSQRRSPES
jgi:hypothetical protein